MFLNNIRGIGVFIALPDMGNSYLLQCFVKSLNPNQYHMEYMCLSTISVADFYKHFCSILGVPNKGGKPAMFRAIHGYSRGTPCLIINLMTDALTIGAQQECQVIDDKIILAAINNQNF